MMIGPRGASAALVTLVLGTLVLVTIGLGAGTPSPEVAINADRLVTERALAADLALASLQEAIDDALETARDGAAGVVAGDDAPGALLTDASTLLLDAGALADDAASRISELEAAREAAGEDVQPLPGGVDGAELESIGLQLAAAVEAADTFAEMRRRAENVPVALDAALAAVRDRDLDRAELHLADARADHEAVAAWEVDFLTLPIWVDATNRTIGAAEGLVAALQAGDVEAARRAADELAALGDEATRADRALGVMISENGGSVVAAPLSRLASAKRLVDAQRAAVGDLLAADRSGQP